MSRHFLVLSLVWWVKTMLCWSSARHVHIWNVTVIVVLGDYYFGSPLTRRWRRIRCIPLKWLTRTLKSCSRERPYSPISVSPEETFHFPLPVLGSAAEMSQHRSKGQDILYLMCWNLPEVLWRKNKLVYFESLLRGKLRDYYVSNDFLLFVTLTRECSVGAELVSWTTTRY